MTMWKMTKMRKRKRNKSQLAINNLRIKQNPCFPKRIIQVRSRVKKHKNRIKPLTGWNPQIIVKHIL